MSIFNNLLKKVLPKIGIFLFTALSTSFLYFYYSTIKLFQWHRQSMSLADYEARFNAAPCSSEMPNVCFWEKVQSTSPNQLNALSNDLSGNLPWIGLVGGTTATFLYHYGDKLKDKAYGCLFGNPTEDNKKHSTVNGSKNRMVS